MASISRSLQGKWFEARYVRTEQRGGELVAVFEFVPKMPLKVLRFLSILINGKEPS